VTLEVIQELILAVGLDSRTHGHHPHDNVHTSPTINSTTELDFHPHNIRSSVGARNRWFDKRYFFIVETNALMGNGRTFTLRCPCARYCFRLRCLTVYCSRTFSLPEPPFFSDRDIAITGWERMGRVTGACVKAEFIAAKSRANCLIDDSDDSVLWFSDYGSNWIKFLGTSEFHHPSSDIC
jgi:carnitine O-acetyltransferase